ncbi:uncharacterized protein [Halyomorpha halys]|uniref:uncharacterized protein n=1 Tax=Halyomorpha halys TaxID=286706 RepID=UPI0006D4EC21|nr:uncharacterized protein LOC106683286 isoform X2 [Halyomorpha halys]
MVPATSLLLLVLLCQNFSVFIECNEKRPKKCYTCSSLVSSRLCGEGFRKLNFLVKDCAPDKKYCIKLIETAGSSSFMYRKCTSNNCTEEMEIRTDWCN